MRSPWITAFAGLIAAVVLGSLLIGLTTPDGSVGDRGTARKIRATPDPTPTATATQPARTAARAPASVSGTWPGRPAATTVSGAKKVDWCPAVRTRGAAEAVREFGEAAVRKAACTAVGFVFDQRYSRLSLPRRAYAAQDFEAVAAALTPTTAADHRRRVAQFVARPGSRAAREALGVVLLQANGAGAGADHTSAGEGRVFYGPAFSTDGYRDRAVWINPSWSTVQISVDRSKAQPRISARLEASAAVPVFHSTRSRDDMMTIPTHAQFFLRRDGAGWRISGWTITGGRPDYAPLNVH